MRDELVEQIVSAPDDLALRLVLADALVEAGDRRGEHIHLEAAGLRAQAAVLAAELPPRHPLLALTWRLGFIERAAVMGDALDVVALLLRHPAARLVEVLSVSVEAGERVRLAALVAARPRPSLLRRLEIGSPAIGRQWLGQADADYVAPVARTAGVATVPIEYVSHDALAATVGADDTEYRNELYMEQIAPVIEMWPYHADLVVRDGHDAAVDEVFDEMPERVESLLRRDGRTITLYQAADRTYAGYGNIFRTLCALAPHVADVRFVVGEWDANWVDEYAIVDGALRVERRDHSGEEHWLRRVADEPRDRELRAYAVRESLYRVNRALEQLDRQTGRERAETARRIASVLDAAAALDDTAPDVWRDRGRLALAIGEHAASDRAFARAAELAELPGLAYDRMLVALAARDAATTARHAERAVAEQPERTSARLVAAFALADDAQLRALLAAVATRAAAITKLEEAQRVLVWTGLETDEENLVRTGRHGELLEWLAGELARLAAAEPALRAPAAAYLLGWAEVSRIHVAHNRNKRAAAGLARTLYAAAAALDPLAGSVHYYWSLFDKRRAAALLAQALANGPDHLCTLGELGSAARKAGDLDRAIELLERYVRGFRALHKGGVWGLYWDFHLGELAISHYERACVALYGVRPGVPRPAGRPSPEALAAAEARIAPALALYDSLSYSQQRAGGGVFHLMSHIQQYRGDHAGALAWADRALATDDNSAYFLSTRGGCLNNLGRLDEAIAHCERALERDPKQWHAHYVIACVLAKQGGERDAIYGHLRKMLRLWPDGRSELAGEPDLATLRAEPAFRRLVRARPTGSRSRAG